MKLTSDRLKNHPLALFSDFRRLFAGRLISAVGDKFFSIAIAWWVISKSGGDSKFQLGLVMAVTVIPVVLFGPVLGTLVDRSDKRRVMLLADAARALCVFILAWLLYADRLSLPALYALCFLISAFGPLFESAVSSSIVRLTSPEKLAGATATDASVMQLSSVAGSALGSVLMAVVGVAGAFLFNALSYLASFFAVLLIRTDLRPAGRDAPSAYMTELRDGLNYVLKSPPLLALLSVFAAFNFFIGPLLILIPMIVQFTLKESVTWLAVFETFFALGSAVTSVAASFRKTYVSVYGTFFRSVLFLGLSFGGLYFTSDKYVVCALLFAAGAALGTGNTAALTLFQHAVPEEMKGRFFAVLTTICYAVLPLTFMINGILAEKFSVGFCIAFNSAAVLAISCVILLIPRLEVRFGAGN
ncbi:MAG: hypothetical protein A2270_09940 [Elusimicrobia bacterium RIFOXYA12_FULL_51_18]|nr:MAG: hypothetical protein A2270_09940 [Elusimicrobia bacterium RIFOXYA12_FULL_51_18]OGS32392.1 MAG: hypothetical protein A2218_02200 [Elusimicrobia bacterium RIFOXYA2_FULL_53_38]